MYKERFVVFLRSFETRKYIARLLNVNQDVWFFDKFAFSYNTVSERMRPIIPEIERTLFFTQRNLLSVGLRQGLAFPCLISCL